MEEPQEELSIEHLAKAIHEAGREAVAKGLVVNKVSGQPFYEWDQLSEEAKEGRRVQARYLVEHGWVSILA